MLKLPDGIGTQICARPHGGDALNGTAEDGARGAVRTLRNPAPLLRPRMRCGRVIEIHPQVTRITIPGARFGIIR